MQAPRSPRTDSPEVDVNRTEVDRALRKRVVSKPPDLLVDGDLPHRLGFAGGVPRSSGAYMIRDLRGLLYIGRTSNLRLRFEQHLRHSHNELLRLALARPWGSPRFAWILDPSPARLEQQLIDRLLPICNEARYRSVASAISN